MPPLGGSARLAPITTVGPFATIDEAMVATDEMWASR
jgi:hypothetical protein